MPKSFYRYALPFLAPLLIFQGRRLKASMPKLPEAAGQRSGVSAECDAYKVLIIGDSAAAGVGVDHQHQALAGQLTNALSKELSLDWCLIAKSGADISDCIAVHQAQTTKDYDVIVISIGVNDVTGHTSASLWQSQLQKLIRVLDKKYHSPHIIFSHIPPMAQFTAIKQPLRWYLGQKSTHLNRLMSAIIERHNRCHLLSISGQLNADDMANDGFHPGPRVYQKWGEQLSQLIISLNKQSIN